MKRETCNNTIELGVKKCSHYTTKQIAVLGILAGAFTAFGGFAATMGAHSIDNFSMSKFVNGSLFSIGLILVLTCGGELFTGNVLTIQAYLEKKITANQFFRNLSIVYIFNFVGVFLVCTLIYFSGLLSSNNGQLMSYIFGATAYKGGLGFSSAFSAGVLCNFLVCLGVWGACGTKSAPAKIILGYVSITGFIVSGFENSIANMFYFSTSLLAKLDPTLVTLSGVSDATLNAITLKSAALNILPVTLGNAFGGIIFVGVAYWTAFEYIPRKAQKSNLVVITPERFSGKNVESESPAYRAKGDVIACCEKLEDKVEEEFERVSEGYHKVVDIAHHRRVYIPEMKHEVAVSAKLDLRYKDFESNYFCH
ncbi:MAG: formate/nitrite transporter family protein [Clostridium sp.]